MPRWAPRTLSRCRRSSTRRARRHGPTARPSRSEAEPATSFAALLASDGIAMEEVRDAYARATDLADKKRIATEAQVLNTQVSHPAHRTRLSGPADGQDHALSKLERQKPDRTRRVPAVGALVHGAAAEQDHGWSCGGVCPGKREDPACFNPHFFGSPTGSEG